MTGCAQSDGGSMDSLKILIVDDEKYVSLLIEKCVDWVANGFEVAGRALTSCEALDMFRKICSAEKRRKTLDYKAAANYWINKDKDSVKMDREELLADIGSFLGKHKVCALATAAGDFVRCTPIEYNYVDGRFYLFSEGGLKFRALESNKNVCLAIYEESAGFDGLAGLQVTGKAELVEPWSDEYIRIVEYKKIPVEALKKLPRPMNLIKIVPTVYDYLNSDLKKKGFSSRQQVKIV